MKRINFNLSRRFGLRRVYVTYLICFFVTISTMISSIVLWATTNEHTTEKMVEHIALCVLTLILLNIPVFMRTKLNFQIPAFLQITVEFFIVAHCVLGEILHFYDYSFIFDKVLHVTAGIIIAVLGFSIVYGFSKTESGKVRLSPFFVAMFSFCFATALLSLWEVFEYAMDSLFQMNMQRWKDSLTAIAIDGEEFLTTTKAQGNGLIDTMTDLIVGMIGAAAICVAGGILIKKHPEYTRFYVTKIPS